MALICTLGNIYIGCTVSRWEKRYPGIYLVSRLEKQTNFYCPSLNRCWKDTSLIAYVNQVVLEAGLVQKWWGEGEEILWLPSKTGRNYLLYKLYLQKDKLLSYGLDLIKNPPMS